MKYTILLYLFYLLFPIVIIYSTQKSNILNKIGTVVLAYVVGLLFGNIGLLPKASLDFSKILAEKSFIPMDEANQLFANSQILANDLLYNKLAIVQDTIISVAILLAIPLLLFSLDVSKWFKFAKDAFKSLFLALISLFIVIFLGFFLFKNQIPEAWKVSGLLVGVYTGGTPNLAAIAAALDVNPNLFILTHTYDLILGAFLLLFLMTIAQRVFNYFLPSFISKHESIGIKIDKSANEMDNFSGILNKKILKGWLKALIIDIIIVGISVGLSFLLPESVKMVTIILTATTLALLLSFFTNINRIEKTFQFGMYLIIVFSLVVSSMADFRLILNIDFLNLFLFVGLAIFGSLIIHVFLSKLFNIDSDTTIITITALTYSPPFVPVVAGALKNKDVLISGITVGIIGYAFGNYIGVIIAYILKLFY